MKTFGDSPVNPGYVMVNDHGEVVPSISDDGTEHKVYGITKREQFAMAAMQGLCTKMYPLKVTNEEIQCVSDLSVILADALISALNKEAQS